MSELNEKRSDQNDGFSINFNQDYTYVFNFISILLRLSRCRSEKSIKNSLSLCWVCCVLFLISVSRGAILCLNIGNHLSISNPRSTRSVCFSENLAKTSFSYLLPSKLSERLSIELLNHMWHSNRSTIFELSCKSNRFVCFARVSFSNDKILLHIHTTIRMVWVIGSGGRVL